MNDVWAMDFLWDKLFDGRPFPDPDDRGLPYERGSRDRCEDDLPGLTWVVEEPERIARQRGKPRSIRVGNGPEFAGRMLDQWADLNKVELDFSRPGKLTDNACIEAFNSRLRRKCLL